MFSAGPGNRSSGKATALRRPALSLSGGYLPDAGGYSYEAAPLSTFHFLHPSTSIRALPRRFEKLSSPAAELPACAPCPPKVPSPVFGSAGRLEGAFRGRVTPPEGPGTPRRGPRSAVPCGRRTPFRRGRSAAAPAPGPDALPFLPVWQDTPLPDSCCTGPKRPW